MEARRQWDNLNTKNNCGKRSWIRLHRRCALGFEQIMPHVLVNCLKPCRMGCTSGVVIWGFKSLHSAESFPFRSDPFLFFCGWEEPTYSISWLCQWAPGKTLNFRNDFTSSICLLSVEFFGLHNFFSRPWPFWTIGGWTCSSRHLSRIIQLLLSYQKDFFKTFSFFNIF